MWKWTDASRATLAQEGKAADERVTLCAAVCVSVCVRVSHTSELMSGLFHSFKKKQKSAVAST